MSRHLTAVPSGRVDDPGIDPDYWRHPVHGVKAIEAKALETVAQAFDGDPHGPRWALTVLALAVDGNTKAIRCHGEALAILSAHLSKPAPKDDASPFGIPRPGGVA